MPTLADALAALKPLENGADLVSAVTAEIEVQKQKVFEVIGEKRGVTSRAQTLETALLAIAKAAGIEGDLEDVLTNAEPKIRAIATEATTLKTEAETLKTQLTEASGKLTTFERRGKLTEIAAAAGANAAVLERLFGDRFDDLKIDGDVVKLGDKPLKEAIAADPGLAPFEVALFAAPSPSPTPTPTPAPARLPGGNPNGTDSKPDPVADHLNKAATGFKAFAAKAG